MTATVPSSNYLIDQEYEVSTNFLVNKKHYTNQTNIEDLNRLISEKSQLKNKAKNSGSYQVILQQSLTTQDKPFLYEILIQTDLNVIRNSLQNLSPKKVVELLNMIKTLLQQHIKLGKGQDHCSSISLWLEQLIKIHLSTIVSNIENKNTIIAIRKFINKKSQQKQNLQKIKQHLLSQQNAREIQSYKHQLQNTRKIPKFQYIEQQRQNIQEDKAEQDDQSEIKDQDMEGLQMDDLEMDDLLQDDF